MPLSAQLSFGRKAGQLEVMLFTRHLSTMIKAGVPLVEALTTLSKQTSSGHFKKIIASLAADVKNGQTLAKALAKFPQSFSQFYRSLIEVSEKSGTLDENLDFVAKELAKSYVLKKKVQAASLYPSLVFTAVIIMGGFIAYFILPQLVDFFEALNVELPLSTRILLFIAVLFRDHGLIIGLLVIGVISLARLTTALPVVKPLWHAFLLKLPLFGPFIRSNQLAQFARNLGVLVKSGVPIVDSLVITANTLSNLTYRGDLLKVSQALARGKNISEAIEQSASGEFPPLVSKMIAIGEKTGKLDETMLYLGDFYEEEVDTFSKNLSTLLEPILLLIIGLIVAFVALAIITPIYELSGSIRR